VHLAANGARDTPHLTGDPDAEPVGVIVTAVAFIDMDAVDLDPGELLELGDHRAKRVTVIGIAVQRLGVQHKLSALWGGNRRGDRDFAAELVGRTRLAAADAFDLGGMQRIDLGPPLMLILMAHPQGKIEQGAEAIFQGGITPSILRRMSRMMRPNRVRRNLSSRRARLN